MYSLNQNMVPRKPYTKGFVLPTILILLFIITVLALSSFDDTIIQNRIATNSNLKSTTHELAEAALIEAEQYIIDKPIREVRQMKGYKNKVNEAPEATYSYEHYKNKDNELHKLDINGLNNAYALFEEIENVNRSLTESLISLNVTGKNTGVSSYAFRVTVWAEFKGGGRTIRSVLQSVIFRL